MEHFEYFFLTNNDREIIDIPYWGKIFAETRYLPDLHRLFAASWLNIEDLNNDHYK